jgi:hypothetical protein
MSYTNGAGTAGRTATIPSFPATCAAGAFIPFNLQIGDTEAQTVQSVTLGTSYLTGTVHLMCLRIISTFNGLLNVGRVGNFAPFKLPTNPCLVPGIVPGNASAQTFTGSMVVSVRG